MKIDDAVILVGGLGSRLGKITKKTPKPLVLIDSNRFLDFLLTKIIKYNFKKIYLLCSYKKEIFFRLYHNKIIHNSKIICIDEGNRKGTGGALYKLKKKIKKNFLLLNGDTYFDINLEHLISRNSSRYDAILALTHKKKSINNKLLTNLKINKDNILTYSNKKNVLMNGGIYILSQKLLTKIENKNISLENDILDKLILNKKVKAYFYDEKFIDIGSNLKLNYLKKNPQLLKNKVFFLDRDGVVNDDKGYVLNYKQFIFLKGVKSAIRYLNTKKYLVILLTNQACIGKNLLTEKGLEIIHKKMKSSIYNSNKGIIDDIFYSPYYKYSLKKKYQLNKFDRKPNIGMFQKAFKKWNVNIEKSLFVGDKNTDMIAANKSKIKFHLKKNISLYNQVREIINNEK